jgi:hypothetical protein
VACHSDHAGVKRYHLKGNFDHALLKKETSANCHELPQVADRRAASSRSPATAAQCHSQQKLDACHL